MNLLVFGHPKKKMTHQMKFGFETPFIGRGKLPFELDEDLQK